jgi:hypothetical protein
MNRGRWRVCDAVWTRLTGAARARRGPGVSGGVWEGERKEGQCGGGAPTCGPGQHCARWRGLNSV